MTKYLSLIYSMMVLSMFASPLYPLGEGDIAPRITLFSTEGGFLNTSTFKNQKFLIISFFYVPCPPCEKEIPHIQKLQNKYSGLKAILISDFKTSREKAKEFVGGIADKSGTPVNLPILLDKFGDATLSFKVVKHPTTFLIDKSGKVVLRLDGYSEDKLGMLDEKTELLSNR